MNLIIVPTHSFVDLITNSSSELFICDTKKSLEAFKEIIVKIVKSYNDLAPEVQSDYKTTLPTDERLFQDIFSEPMVCQLNAFWPDCPFFGEYEMARQSGSYSRFNREWHPEYIKNCEKVKQFETENPTPDYKKHKTEYNKWNDRRIAIMNEWWTFEFELQLKMIRWAFEQNGLPWVFEDLRKSQSALCEADYIGPKEKKDYYFTIFREFSGALSWNFNLKKGSIFLSSASDNTVPYDLFPMIERVFTCERKHLG